MNLVGIQPFMAIGEWVWSEDPSEDVSPDICLNDVPFMSSGCFERLIVKGLGVAIILGSFLNMAPMIVNVISSKSVTGLSLGSLYGALLMYCNGAFYGLLQGHPITAYGENLALNGQTMVLVLTIWKLQDKPPVSMQHIVTALTGYVSYCFAALYLLPEEMQYLLLASNWPLLLYSRGSQILTTQQLKHTGPQSIITITLNLVGVLIRILTTISEVGWDMTLLSGFALSAVMSFILFVQYFVFRSNTVEFLAELEKKKKE
mmetsp:Transcript_14766/g.23091  ORF Transcript_14766/g.23091 Transcript_14766/m.23091 type:complete len:260 (-) Transcript_14766:951-1730(-)|eukprot:CAMPEP_0195307562 /NCGR_PEP_ID=MMETSP0707-20130614/37780_1 /TAXON_ID=33640 /ORGANISM="Asterionellopsis glacialis, Strain CCMP134" /LENGTH=259 /DNA_ID=CAMNT_0040371815 /DNA_START=102 /DNA_END=881 /DNA_ORIENTATION=+